MTIKIHDKHPKTYVILGAPGTATSLISKALEEQGIDMGNTKGYGRTKFYENKEFEDLNKEIIEAAKKLEGTKDLPSEESIMAVDFEDKIKKIIKKHKGEFWGWKDPKNSLTLKKFLPHLEGDVYLICCFRKPYHLLHMYNWYRNRTRKENRGIMNTNNRSIISIIKEFCKL